MMGQPLRKRLCLSRFALSAIFILSSSYVFSQIRTPFPDSTGAWTIRFSSSDCCPPTTTYEGFRYYINGDTVLNSLSYHKLYRGNTNLSDSTGSYYGAFRESGQKIYYRGQNNLSISSSYSDTVEYLLYDFNLGVGDSVLILNCSFPSDSGYLYVQSIDSVLLNGFYYQRWNFSSYFSTNPQWIEGIGSMSGFFPYNSYSCPIQWDNELACFHENNEDIIFNIFGASSCQTVGLSNLSAYNDFKLFPNPCNGNFSISLGSGKSNSTITVYDIMGKIVLTERIAKFQENYSIAGYDDGIYFVTVNSNGSRVSQKLILSR